MKRSIRTVLATSAALALTGLGVAPAAATAEPPKQDEAKYVKVDERSTFPAGYACKDEIKVHEKFKYRFTVLKENKHRAKYKEELHDGWAKFYNPKTHKWVMIPIHETAYIHENRKNATAVTKAHGKGYLQGKGIKGIVAWKGDIKVKVSNLDDLDNVRFDIKSIHGHSKQLCYKLGSKPVWGKNIPQPE